MLVSRVLRKAEGGAFLFWCPGCECLHQVWHGRNNKPSWDWNGNAEKPTFRPSLRIQWAEASGGIGGDGAVKEMTCHLFITDGKLQFLDDCTHHLKGKTVDMKELF